MSFIHYLFTKYMNSFIFKIIINEIIWLSKQRYKYQNGFNIISFADDTKWYGGNFNIFKWAIVRLLSSIPCNLSI